MIILGSDFSTEFRGFMEGAVRIADQKINRVLKHEELRQSRLWLQPNKQIFKEHQKIKKTLCRCFECNFVQSKSPKKTLPFISKLNF